MTTTIRLSSISVPDQDAALEISQKDYGVDFGIRDPFGNRVRVGTTNAS